jgi:hypothetical protein
LYGCETRLGGKKTWIGDEGEEAEGDEENCLGPIIKYSKSLSTLN